MLYNIWRWIQLWLPYGLILHMYKAKKGIPANIRTAHGRALSAVMITTEYGVIYTNETYVRNRAKVLKKQQEEAYNLSNKLLQELNNLSFAEREALNNDNDTI